MTLYFTGVKPYLELILLLSYTNNRYNMGSGF